MGLHVVVLAGGSGTRLWPLSRSAVPKHLLPLGRGGATLLRTTVERVLPIGDSVHVVTAADQADACRHALDGLGLGRDAIIAEPTARGTGPALGLATRWIARDDPGAIICSVHADHVIGDDDAYRSAIYAAAGWAHTLDSLATIGITPRYASVALGYVAKGVARDTDVWQPPPLTHPASAGFDDRARMVPAHASAGFVEKPPLEVAERFVREGTYVWNSGLFAWPAAVFEAEIRSADAAIDRTVGEVVLARAAGDEHLAAARYASLTSIAVDPLVFERTARLTVVEGDFGWSDIGSWNDLLASRHEAGDGDAQGNVIDGDAIVFESEGCLVSSQGGRLVAVTGATDLVVVDTGDAVLVAPAGEVQHVRDIVERLRLAGRSDLL